MQVEVGNNYNPLGRMGPIHPRPEYRPGKNPSFEPRESEGPGQDAALASRKRTERNKAESKGSAPVQSPATEGRLNLQGAKTLTELAAQAIRELDGQGTKNSPHRVDGLGLMAPHYI
ncbi:MAG: hypothetical protein LBJ64_11430 [Deltaproteobacteria bacterium]|jgi:hypothetical protein|nr:hypothetical protein [Deltaproteobacteria bacterium]